MNCKSFEDVVVDLARLTPLEASVRDAALAHAACCDGCGRRLAREKLLTGGLQNLATETRSAVPPDHIQENLIAALRQQKLSPQPARTNFGWRYLAVAAAILFAIALGIAGYKMRQASPVDLHVNSAPPLAPPATIISTLPTKETGKAPVITPRPSSVVAGKHRTRKLRPDPSQSTFVSVVVGAVSDSETSEVVSPFMPLGYSNSANIQDGAQVVRVELPRYAMARFGLPVNMERYDERVKADVWLGPDGLARAIRFVQ